MLIEEQMTRALCERIRIWKENEAMAMHLLSRADPTGHVLVVADATDPVGQPLCEALVAQEGCAASLAQLEHLAARRDHIPTLLVLFPVQLAAQLLRASNPAVARSLLHPMPEGSLPVVVIAAGGSTLLLTRKPPQAREGSIGTS